VEPPPVIMTVPGEATKPPGMVVTVAAPVAITMLARPDPAPLETVLGAGIALPPAIITPEPGVLKLAAGVPELTAGVLIVATGAPIMAGGAPIMAGGAPMMAGAAPKLAAAPTMAGDVPKLAAGAPTMAEDAPKLATGAPKLSVPLALAKVVEVAPMTAAAGATAVEEGVATIGADAGGAAVVLNATAPITTVRKPLAYNFIKTSTPVTQKITSNQDSRYPRNT